MAIQPPDVHWMLRYNRLLADACLQATRAADGLLAINEALRMLESGRRHIEQPELYRLKGELLLLQNTAARSEAESCFREAVEIARRQQAKSWELRAALPRRVSPAPAFSSGTAATGLRAPPKAKNAPSVPSRPACSRYGVVVADHVILVG